MRSNHTPKSCIELLHVSQNDSRSHERDQDLGNCSHANLHKDFPRRERSQPHLLVCGFRSYCKPAPPSTNWGMRPPRSPLAMTGGT